MGVRETFLKVIYNTHRKRGGGGGGGCERDIC